MSKKINRRDFIGAGIVAGAASKGFVSNEEKILMAAIKEGADTPKKKSKTQANMPVGKIGDLTISRLIAGGNLLSGWCHERDLLFVSELAQSYLTEEKQFDTLELCEEHGVNTIGIDMNQLEIITKYKRIRGGKIQTIANVYGDFGNTTNPTWAPLRKNIDKAIDNGADTLYLHGGYCDRLVEAGKKRNVELLGEALEHIRDLGFSAGLGSHSLHVPMECSKLGIEPDYYFKTFHHDKYWSATPKDKRKDFCVDADRHLDHNGFHDNIFCIKADETLKFMESKKQPWIAFKVLAAGAIHPSSGFEYAFKNGADFLTVGMFDFNVIEDAKIARKTYTRAKKRKRPWCA